MRRERRRGFVPVPNSSSSFGGAGSGGLVQRAPSRQQCVRITTRIEAPKSGYGLPCRNLWALIERDEYILWCYLMRRGQPMHTHKMPEHAGKREAPNSLT
jgi:hypothetical protein